MIYDLIIIGAGPAGITAAIYAARRKINFLVMGLDIGGQMSWSSDVENYPGLHFLSGLELTQKFKEHMADYKINVKNEEVTDIRKKGKIVVVKTKKNTYEAVAAIIASGKKPRKLNVPGEEEFLGKGVNYCATCDAPLYKDKTAAVVGGGNSALDAALFLSKYAKKIYLLDINPKLGGETQLRDQVVESKKITHIPKAFVKKITGDKFVNGLVYSEGKDGPEKSLKIDAVFIEVGLISRCDFAKTIKKNNWGEIMITRSTISNEENLTSISGIFAAGDVTDIPAKQIVAAAGEGCKAAIAAFDYITKQKKKIGK